MDKFQNHSRNIARGASNRRHGQWAERLARLYFRLHGWSIVAANYKTGRGTHAGEVDFIAQKKHTLVFVEVKERATLEGAAYAVGDRQKRRLIKAAESFVARHTEFAQSDIRFDVCLVRLPFSIVRIQNAWSA